MKRCCFIYIYLTVIIINVKDTDIPRFTNFTEDLTQ